MQRSLIGSRFTLADTLASGRLPPIVYMPEGGGSAPPLGLEVVGVIDLARWLAVFVLAVGLRPCSLCRGDDTEPKFVLTRESVCWK